MDYKKVEKENEISISSEEIDNCKIREKDKILILEVLEEINQGTISEIHSANEQLAEYSNQYVSSLLRELVEEYRVSKTIQRNKSVFTAIAPVISDSLDCEFDDNRAQLMKDTEDKNLIITVLGKIGKGTVTEIQWEDEQLGEYSQQKIQFLLNSLTKDGIVREKMVGRKRMYELV